MMRDGNKKNFITILSIAIVSAFVFASPIYSQQLAKDSLSIGYAPTAEYLTLKPGEKYKGEVTVWNLSPTKRTYDVIVRGFKQVENYPGTARIHTEEEEARDVFSGAKWVKVPFKELTLVSNQYYTIPFEINVPKDNASGEFHAMIFLMSQTATAELGQASGSISNLGAGPAIFMKIGDEIIEKAELEYFRAEKPFYELPPVTFLSRYINKGNTHITPAGDIIISNFLKQEVDRISFNENGQSLMRGNAGNYEDEWKHDGIFFRNGKLSIGPLSAQLITTYLSENPGYAPLSASTSFWVLPWKHILAIIVIAGIMYKIIFRRKKKNEKKSAPPTYPSYPGIS